MIKTLAATLTLFTALTVTLLAQGRVNFNNYVSGNVITVGDGGIFPDPNQGVQGNHVGAAYSIQLLWAAGTFTDFSSFMGANPSRSVGVPFFGSIGGSPGTDGAGLFDGGTVDVGALGTYTMMAQAWYNNGQYSTFEAARLGFGYTGRSSLFTINATAAPTPAPNTVFPSFTVSGFVPEPATYALMGLGVGALLLYRRIFPSGKRK